MCYRTLNRPWLQRSEQQQFLFETTVEQPVQETLRDIVTIHNLRQRIAKLKLEGGELAQFGFAKQPDKQGIDTYSDENIEKGEFYKMDPTGRRTGNGAAQAPACSFLLLMNHRAEHSTSIVG